MEKQLEALNAANDYIEKLKTGIEDLVNKINSGEENNGVQLIPNIADGLQWLVNIIELTKDLHKGSISIENIKEQLGEIIEALENEDYVLLGDLFNYELLPILVNIQVDIKKVIEIN